MDYDFLKNFDTRMKRVGTYALFFRNSMQKTTWKKYGFDEFGEQTNLIFASLLYIMEQSLKEEPCTLDDIGSFIDSLNMSFFRKQLSYDECKELADFIVNTVLCDDGNAMYFNGYDFSQKSYRELNISFLLNEIKFLDDTVRRTSYKLSNDGYSLLLSTLEMEANMRLTIHEFIFKMHMEKQSYDKAVEDVKNIFSELRRQLQKMQEAMLRIRQNALSYSVAEYRALMDENILSLESTKTKFDNYKNHVRERILEFEEKDINIRKLGQEEQDNLGFLRTIESYLARSIAEQQKILLAHFDLKVVYARELEDLAQMSLIKRFNFRTELYDKVLADPLKLENLHVFLKPLFKKGAGKTYNINKSLQYQKPLRKGEADSDEEMVSFDEEEWEVEQQKLRKEKLSKYKRSLGVILKMASEKGSISLKEIGEAAEKDRSILEQLVPTVEIFREIVIELLKNRSIDISELKEEKEKFTDEIAPQFQLNESILNMVEEDECLAGIIRVASRKAEGSGKVRFSALKSEDGSVRTVTCSDVIFEVKRR